MSSYTSYPGKVLTDVVGSDFLSSPYLRIMLVPLIGLFLVSFQIWDIEPYKLPINTKTPLWVTMPTGFLCAIAAFCLLFRVVYEDVTCWIRFNRWCLLLSIAAFETAVLVKYHVSTNYYVTVVATGVMAGLFTYVNPKDFILRAVKVPRATLLTLIASLTVGAYCKFLPLMWNQLCNATAFAVSTTLNFLGMNTSTKLVEIWPNFFLVHVHTPYFEVSIWPACSGLEGISLFILLLSLMLLFDWRVFNKWCFTELYLYGFVYMFIINTVRISAFFIFGSAMHDGSATQYIIDIFHSWIGWMLYFIAFGVFATLMYARASRQMRLKNNQE